MTNPPEPPPYPGGPDEPVPPPPAYPPPYGAAVPVAPAGSSKATTALVLGILGILCCGPLGIIAIVIGRQATAEAAAAGAPQSSSAKAGIILGWIAVALMAVAIVFWGLFFALGMAGVFDAATTY